MTGDDASGSTAVVSTANQLAVEWVEIRSLDGFTGSYNAGLTGRAHVDLAGSTYTIAGDAEGFTSQRPSFAARRAFSIVVAC